MRHLDDSLELMGSAEACSGIFRHRERTRFVRKALTTLQDVRSDLASVPDPADLAVRNGLQVAQDSLMYATELMQCMLEGR